jgi:hypothetical protein
MNSLIQCGQIYRHRKHGEQLLIFREKGDRWKAKVLTAKPGVYAGTHTMLSFILRQKYHRLI